MSNRPLIAYTIGIAVSLFFASLGSFGTIKNLIGEAKGETYEVERL